MFVKGVDIASLPYKKQVDQVVLSQTIVFLFLLQNLHCEKELYFIVDSVGQNITSDFMEHIDESAIVL